MRALVKLEQVLPAHLRRRVQALQSATMTLPTGGGPTVDPQTLTVIAAACRDHERLRFGYHGRDGAATPPRGRAALARQRRAPLVPRRVGLRARDDWRTFRVDRLTRPARRAAASRRASCPPRTAPPTCARASPRRPNRYEARLTLHAPAAELRKRRAGYWGPFEPIDDAHAASTARATTTSTGSRRGSRCSASTSTSTSRRSSSSTSSRSGGRLGRLGRRARSVNGGWVGVSLGGPW